MKRKCAFCVLLFIFLAQPFLFSSVKRTLIDFNQYNDRIKQIIPEKDLRFEDINGKINIVYGYDLYLLDNWKIDFDSRVDIPINQYNSFTKEVESSKGKVLGMQVRFTNWRNPAISWVRPRFDLPIFDLEGQFVNIENGLLPNINKLKSISTWIYSFNTQYELFIRLRDNDQNTKIYNLGMLNHIGWKEMVYQNSFYSENIDFYEKSTKPVYPRMLPFVLFDGIGIKRSAEAKDARFTAYFEKIEIEYLPELIAEQTPNDINDEQVWGLIKERTQKERYDKQAKDLSSLQEYYRQKARISQEESIF